MSRSANVKIYFIGSNYVVFQEKELSVKFLSFVAWVEFREINLIQFLPSNQNTFMEKITLSKY